MKARIAIQNKGRLMESSIVFLRMRGFCFEAGERQLLVKCIDQDVEILFVRCKDIPTYLQQGVADFGIVGENILLEQNCKSPVIESLGFAKCSLVIAGGDGQTVDNLEGERIATSYPETLKKYLSEKNLNASIVKVGGSVEAAVSLNLADAICDITQTGKTLEENNLKIIDKLFDSQAVLIGESKEKWNCLIKSL